MAIMKQIRGTETSWLASTIILEDGQLGYDTTNNILKMGNGNNLFKDLLPVNDSEHCDCPTILDENGKIIESLLPDDLCSDLIQEMEDKILELEEKLNILLYVPVESISLNETTLAITEGDTLQLIVTILPEEATNKTVTWTSSDTTIANIDNTGLITTIKDGSVTITCISNDNNELLATCSITVEELIIPVTDVIISPDTKIIVPGETFNVTSIVSPDNATNKDIEYSSSNISIATVGELNGLVTGVSSGSCNITVTTFDGNFTSSCNLTVEEALAATTVTIYASYTNEYSKEVEYASTIITCPNQVFPSIIRNGARMSYGYVLNNVEGLYRYAISVSPTGFTIPTPNANWENAYVDRKPGKTVDAWLFWQPFVGMSVPVNLTLTFTYYMEYGTYVSGYRGFQTYLPVCV